MGRPYDSIVVGGRTVTQELKHRVAIDDDESLDGPTLRAVPFEATSSPGETRLLSRRQRLQLARIATRIRLPQRMVLYREESIAHWVFFVADGVMKSFHDLPSGKRRIMAFLFADDVFGLAQHG